MIYQKQPFDLVEDVKRATEEHFLTGRDIKASALARGKNLSMYHLVIVPIIEMFKGVSHEDVLKNIDSVLDQARELLYTLDITSHHDDALVTLAQVGVMITKRENARKLEKAKSRLGKRKKKRKNDIADWVDRKRIDGSLD